jgi:hypothetical protein
MADESFAARVFPSRPPAPPPLPPRDAFLEMLRPGMLASGNPAAAAMGDPRTEGFPTGQAGLYDRLAMLAQYFGNALPFRGGLGGAPRRFTTAKGSVYEVQETGSTIRNKAPRPEHPGDFGLKPPSDQTWYVTKAQADQLSEIQTRGGPRKRLAQHRDGRIGVQYLEGPDAGKFESRTMVTPARTPQLGLHPVEVWGDVTHVGHPIIHVEP